MMKFTKPNLRTLSTALTLGVLSFGFAPAAMAISTYDAAASFSLTLTDVTDVTGATVTSGWSVDAFGSGDVFLTESGVASATGSTSVVDPAVSLSIGSGITQSAAASGTATDGFAWTDILTDLDITSVNTSLETLTFNFDYSVMLNTEAIGIDSIAEAAVFVWDGNVTYIDSFIDGTNQAALTGTIEFILGAGETKLILAQGVDVFGEAAAVIPVPAAVWLFGSGLLGLVGVARRKQAA